MRTARNKKSDAAEQVSDIAWNMSQVGTEWVTLERPATVASIVTAVITAIAPVAFLITTQESRSIGLLELVTVVDAPIADVISTPVAIEVRALGIIVLATFGIAGTSGETVLVALINCNLRDISGAAVTIVSTIITVTPVLILAVRPLGILGLDGRAGRDSNSGHECQPQQNSPDFVPEMM